VKVAPIQTQNARLILQYAREARDGFQKLCDEIRLSRTVTGGALTHVEQDLLRAMVVFAAAGLDALVKRLMRDALPTLSTKDKAVQQELETFVVKQLRGDLSADESDAATGRKFLGRVLVSRNPLLGVTEQYIRDLTGESMQSPEQVFRAAKAFGVEPLAELHLEKGRLKDIFDTRNEIIHEMDIDLESRGRGTRKRRSRTVDEMADAADYLLQIAERLIDAVEQRLVTPTPIQVPLFRPSR